MRDQVYKKVGRKYIPIGYSDGWTGFPSEGIWVVYNKPGCKSSDCIASLGNFKNIDYSKLATLVKERETECLQAVIRLREGGKNSTYDIVKVIFEELCKNGS